MGSFIDIYSRFIGDSLITAQCDFSLRVASTAESCDELSGDYNTTLNSCKNMRLKTIEYRAKRPARLRDTKEKSILEPMKTTRSASYAP